MYDLCILRQATKDIANLPKDYARLVSQHIERLAGNPRPLGAKQLSGRTDYSLRVGVYRILYEIDEEAKSVTIYRVKHRREVYR